MRFLVKLLAFSLLSLPALVQAVAATESDEPQPAWVKLPALPGKVPNISGIGIDPGGTFWVMLATGSDGQQLYWLDGKQWQKPEAATDAAEEASVVETTDDSENAGAADGADEAGQIEGGFLRGLHGGNGGKLYAAAAEGERGTLYELAAGGVESVTGFTYAPPENDTTRRRAYRRRPTLFVSRAGRAFCVGESFVNVLVEGQWRPVAAPEASSRVSFLNAGEKTYLFYDTMLCTVAADGKATARSLGGLTVRADNMLDAYLWGDDRLLVVENRVGLQTSILYAYSLETGKALDVDELRDALTGHHIFDAFSGPDGSVWLYTTDPSVVPTVYAFRFLTPEGDLFEIEETKQLDWGFDRSRFFPQSVLVASDGTVWLGQYREGVVSYKAGVFKRYGEAAGFPFGFRFVAEAPGGAIYAASSNAVYTSRPSQAPGEKE